MDTQGVSWDADTIQNAYIRHYFCRRNLLYAGDRQKSLKSYKKLTRISYKSEQAYTPVPPDNQTKGEVYTTPKKWNTRDGVHKRKDDLKDNPS